jgi:DNA-damage-inducible protein J
LQEVGLTSAEAIRLFYMQICLQKGLPFKVTIPQKNDIEKLSQFWEPHFFEFEAMPDLPDFSKYRKEF